MLHANSSIPGFSTHSSDINKELLPFRVEVVSHEITLVKKIMNVTGCTYSLVLNVPVAAHMVDVKGYFMLSDTCLYITHS